MKKLISIDIGSTYTKGFLFYLYDNILLPAKRYQISTTVNHLADGFFEVLYKLLENENIKNFQDIKNYKDLDIFYSSSAKGGLKIIAIGIVPELTLKIARLTALSAGGKVTKSFSYRLTVKNIKQIEEENPDIILFTGGTDGGNEEINIHNAQMLSNMDIKPVILYAGNTACADEIFDIFIRKNFEIKITENVMPEIEKINIEPAKSSIRDIFLKNIIHGKGLDEIVEKIGFYPEPTPLSVFNFISGIPENVKKIKKNLKELNLNINNRIKTDVSNLKSFDSYINNFSIKIKEVENILNYDWESFIAIDMGGATTDFYSYHRDVIEDSNVMIKGIIEPTVKRTVEGDLGMRVSAKAVFECGVDYVKQIFKIKKEVKGFKLIEMIDNEEDFVNRFWDYVCKVNQNTSYLPENDLEIFFDEIIASICIKFSGLRHAGKYKRIFTINGEKFIQYGKNLKNVKTMIGSGGYLARMEMFNPKELLTFSYESFFNKKQYYELEEEIALLPENFVYLRDKEYLLPILANISKKYQYEATLCLMMNLEEKIKYSS
ncbi:MAG: glutamate mutase L [Spirochaetes bacterium]|nr:glutamate mutase L [Spirochaetota bacterium]